MDLFIQLLRIAIGNQERFERNPTKEEWDELSETVCMQTVIGVCYAAIEKLPAEQKPPQDLLAEWHQLYLKIQERSKTMNLHSYKVAERFGKDGFRGCVLKGQGNAMHYPNPLDRQPGDIDIWLIPRKEDMREIMNRGRIDWRKNRMRILRYTKGFFRHLEFRVHHVEFPAKKDIVNIEAHFYPIYLANPIAQRRLLRWFGNMAEEQFAHTVKVGPTPKGRMNDLVVPTPLFNAVFQLIHIFKHYLDEGIGMRQILDYYYVMKNLRKEEHAEVRRMLKDIYLTDFAQAMMYVMKDVLGMEEQYLYTSANEKRGMQLLKEIGQSGNFGHFETRFWKREGNWLYYQAEHARRNIRFLRAYPQQVVWDFPSRIHNTLWRKWTAWKLEHKEDTKKSDVITTPDFQKNKLLKN